VGFSFDDHRANCAQVPQHVDLPRENINAAQQVGGRSANPAEGVDRSHPYNADTLIYKMVCARKLRAVAATC
jgi:hypothetical protein